MTFEQQARWTTRPSRWMSMLLGATLCGLLTACIAMPGPAQPDPQDVPAGTSPAPTSRPVVLVIDGSGSMAAPDMGGQTTRLAAAQQAAKAFVEGLPEGTDVALVSLGDTAPREAPLSAETCADVTVRVPPDRLGPAYVDEVNKVTPSGWTPLSAALTRAAEIAPDGPAHIVLITDGEDSCAPPDPCETAGAVVAQHPGLAVSTIGVRASSAQLECIAGRGGGTYVTADSAAQLARRLQALHDPAHAATLLSPRGLSRIVPGQKAADIRARHRDFPEVPPVQAGSLVEVVWRACLFAFDEQGLLREISLQDGATIDGLTVGSPEVELALLGAPVMVSPLPGGGESRIYVADASAGLGWYVEIAGDRVTRIVLCGGCLPPQSTSSWIPCAGAQWAVEGEDHNGRLIVAMCEDGMGTYADGRKLGSLAVHERYPFGGRGSADGRQVVIDDVRTDQVITFMSGRNATVTRQLAVTRRYPDSSCAVTPGMREALRVEGVTLSGRLLAVCVDDWARVSSTDLGDSTVLLRSVRGRWEFYTGFPTDICHSKFTADGGPRPFGPPYAFRDC